MVNLYNSDEAIRRRIKLCRDKETKPNEPNLFRIEYCVMRIAKTDFKNNLIISIENTEFHI
jgi:hypothetical protein